MSRAASAILASLSLLGLFLVVDTCEPHWRAAGEARRRAARRADPDERVDLLLAAAHREGFVRFWRGAEFEGLDLSKPLQVQLDGAALDHAYDSLEREIERRRTFDRFDELDLNAALELCIELWGRFHAEAVRDVTDMAARRDAAALHAWLVRTTGEIAWSREQVDRALSR